MTDVVAVSLYPSHGKHVVVAVDRADLDLACKSMRKLDPIAANKRRLKERVALYMFHTDDPHTEADWDEFFTTILSHVCLAHVTQGKPLPLVPVPDDHNSVWFVKVDVPPLLKA